MRLFIVSIAIVMLTSFTAPPERISWSQQQNLAWTDFKGSKNSLDSWAASSSTGISQSYAINSKGYLDKNSVLISAYFYPHYSWVEENKKTEYLLAHEQAHFDITEVYRRKLENEISKTVFTSDSKTEIKNLYNTIEKQRIATQELFDKETNHSLKRDIELAWRKQIEKWLSDSRP